MAPKWTNAAMSTIDIMIIIGVATLLLSIISSLIIVAYMAGKWEARVSVLEAKMNGVATKDELVAIKSTLDEIKGMFRLTLKEG